MPSQKKGDVFLGLLKNARLLRCATPAYKIVRLIPHVFARLVPNHFCIARKYFFSNLKYDFFITQAVLIKAVFSYGAGIVEQAVDTPPVPLRSIVIVVF